MVSDRVLALNYGKVLATGSPAEVQSHPDVIAAYLGG
jgi:branched-chain amino acid transport system ATP-binding protein